MLIEYVEPTGEPVSQTTSGGEETAIVKQDREEEMVAVTRAAIKTENVIEHHGLLQKQQQQQRQRQQQQLAYVTTSEETGEESGVGVLGAGQQEIENGVMVESTGADAVAIAVDHIDEPHTTYTLQQLSYHPSHIIHER